ncbi:phage major capsid protein [Burkholderia pseudomallei]|uniref:phage major capsid protein n=1 Tax=Burkholderia pseudomallei TaxID=28450 RepID=UPI003F881573
MGLQNPSSTLTEIVTTTLRNRTGKLADNVTKNNALLYRLRRRGNVKTVSGGRTIVQELEYAENGTFKRYSGYEALNISPSDVFTGAEFNYAQAAVAVSISGLEQLQNSGEDAIIDLLESRIKNAEKTLVNNIALDCYSDGTADGGRQIGGLQLLVSATPTTGVVGGIDASTSIGSFWRNTAFSAVTNARRRGDVGEHPVVHEPRVRSAGSRHRPAGPDHRRQQLLPALSRIAPGNPAHHVERDGRGRLRFAEIHVVGRGARWRFRRRRAAEHDVLPEHGLHLLSPAYRAQFRPDRRRSVRRQPRRDGQARRLRRQYDRVESPSASRPHGVRGETWHSFPMIPFSAPSS